MLSFLASKPGTPVPEAEIQARYNRFKMARIIRYFYRVRCILHFT